MNEEAFHEILINLVGHRIGVYVNNGPYIEGRLIGVKNDHIIVRIGLDVLYFDIRKIHAVVNNARYAKPIVDQSSHVDKALFEDILVGFKYRLVTINGLSNQVFSGLLSKVTEDHVVLINKEDYYFIQKSMIANITEGIIEASANQESGDTSPGSKIKQSKEKQTEADSGSKKTDHVIKEENTQQTNIPAEPAQTSDHKYMQNNSSTEPLIKEFLGNIAQIAEMYNQIKKEKITGHTTPETLPTCETANSLSSPTLNKDFNLLPETQNPTNQTNPNKVTTTKDEEANLPCKNSSTFLPKNQSEQPPESTDNKIEKVEGQKNDRKEQNQILEAQYLALMEHAKKMYLGLKKDRLES